MLLIILINSKSNINSIFPVTKFNFFKIGLVVINFGSCKRTILFNFSSNVLNVVISILDDTLLFILIIDSSNIDESILDILSCKFNCFWIIFFNVLVEEDVEPAIIREFDIFLFLSWYSLLYILKSYNNIEHSNCIILLIL